MVAGAPESNLHSAASNNNNLYPLIKRGKLKTECEWKIPTKSNMRQFNMQGKRGTTLFLNGNHAFVFCYYATQY